MGIQISPSMLASDFANLASEAERVSNADWLHVDVMDNHFVPNLTLGLPVVEALGRAASTPMDCHLMIEDPGKYEPGVDDPTGEQPGLRVEGRPRGPADRVTECDGRRARTNQIVPGGWRLRYRDIEQRTHEVAGLVDGIERGDPDQFT